MKTSDKWLLGIVVGAILLVAAAIAVTVLRPKPSYRSDAAPAGVAFNYLLALKKKDYPRAYSYLSPTLPGYPANVDKFTDAIADNYNFDFEHVALDTGDTEQRGNRTIVKVKKTTFSSDGLYGSQQYTSSFDVVLRHEGNAWKIIHADEYWAWAWEEKPRANDPER